MVAHQLLVPKGWEVEGGIQAPPPSYNMIPYLSDVTVESPDKRGVRFWGINEFGYADNVSFPPFTAYEGRPYFPPQRSLGDFWLRLFELNPGPGISKLKVVSESELPDLTALVQKQLASLYRDVEQENRQLTIHGMTMKFDVHGRRLVIRYLDEGTDVEATVFATMRHTSYHYANGATKAGMWTLDNMYAALGPAGTDYLMHNDANYQVNTDPTFNSRTWQRLDPTQ
jgi:hypothetical protein